ncbi:MAG: cell division protein FtsQ/DivIB [Treponemataceae bacterium]
MNSEIRVNEMNSFYSVRDAIRNEEEKKVSNYKKTNVLKILLIVLIFVLVMEALIYTIFMPCLTPVKITYTGLKSFSPQQVSNYLQISPKLTWMQFDSGKIAAKLAGNMVIESVTIQKHFPDQVSINIVERTAVAISLAVVDGKTVPVQIDKNGVIFAVGRGIPKEKVPLVTGFSFDNISEGMRINSKLKPLMQQISEISEKNPAYFSLISEIRIVARDYGSYELELYPTNSNIKVLIDRTLNEQTLQYMIVMLDVLNSMGKDISVVDMRYGSISYR